MEERERETERGGLEKKWEGRNGQLEKESKIKIERGTGLPV